MTTTRLGAFIVMAFAAGCVVPQATVQSTATVLGRERSGVVVAKAQREAALDVVSKFATRGYALTSVHTDEQGYLILRIAGARRMSTSVDAGTPSFVSLQYLGDDDYWAKQAVLRKAYERDIELGSAFYVSVSALAPEQSAIVVIGRPMHEGQEACTTDLPAGCVRLGSSDAPAGELMGYAEAEVIEGVFAEMRLAGGVLSADPREDSERFARKERCLARQREVQAAADQVSYNPRARAGILRTLPRCDEPAAVVAR